MNENKESKQSLISLTVSLVVHGALFFAMGAAANRMMVPEGTVMTGAFNYKQLPVPKGEQTEIQTVEIQPVEAKKLIPKVKSLPPPPKVAKAKLAPVAPPIVEGDLLVKKKKIKKKKIVKKVPKKIKKKIAKVVNKKESVERLPSTLPTKKIVKRDMTDDLDDIVENEIEEPVFGKGNSNRKVAGSNRGIAKRQRREASPFGIAGGIVDARNLKQVPGNVPPSYPWVARLRKQEGKVVLVYLVTPSGKVSNVMVERSSGFRILDRMAIAAVSKYQYYPSRNGTYARHPINFDLRGAAQHLPGHLGR